MDNIHLATIDWLILATYFVLTLVVGLIVARMASRSIRDYFLGGRRVPWWAPDMSGSASNFDMTGTMVITSFYYHPISRFLGDDAGWRWVSSQS